MDMTPSQKAKITRQKHREAQRAKEAKSREVKAKLKASLLTVVDNEEATPAEKLESVCQKSDRRDNEEATPAEKLEASKLLMELI